MGPRSSPAFHVDFPHSRHVNAGVACQNCHGEIQGMERVRTSLALTMGECLACHRAENQKLQLNGKPPRPPHRLRRLPPLRRNHARMEEPRRTAGTHQKNQGRVQR
ncbi:MAG: cytochrome c3 family protein [Holophagaceae bacterium]|nr:cytochrome c3 family protein [Holophagaceae bacterium]